MLAFLLLSLPLLRADPSAMAPPKPGDDLGTITTVDGKTYAGAKLATSEPDGITIIYSDGGAKILLQNLPADLQKRFGLDPQKAEIYALKAYYEQQIVDLTQQNAKLRYELSQYKGALTESQDKPKQVSIAAFHCYLYSVVDGMRMGYNHNGGLLGEGPYAGMPPSEATVLAQQEWGKMSDEQKQAYEKMAEETGDPITRQDDKIKSIHSIPGPVIEY